jgi:hypothetical protein
MTAASSLPPSRREPLPPGFHVETRWSPGTEQLHADRRRSHGGKLRGDSPGRRLLKMDPTMADRGAGTDETTAAAGLGAPG